MCSASFTSSSFFSGSINHQGLSRLDGGDSMHTLQWQTSRVLSSYMHPCAPCSSSTPHLSNIHFPSAARNSMHNWFMVDGNLSLTLVSWGHKFIVDLKIVLTSHWIFHTDDIPSWASHIGVGLWLIGGYFLSFLPFLCLLIFPLSLSLSSHIPPPPPTHPIIICLIWAFRQVMGHMTFHMKCVASEYKSLVFIRIRKNEMIKHYIFRELTSCEESSLLLIVWVLERLPS